MTLDIWLTYILTVLLLMSTPGPSQILMLSNSMSHGFRRSLLTAAGDLTANVLQMVAAGLGLSFLITSSENTFLAIKWLGVAYLVFVGWRKIRDASGDLSLDTDPMPKTLRRLWLDGFLTSATNPKAVIFFASLFPQFLNPNQPLAHQILLLGATYVLIDGSFLSVYGKTAAWVAGRLRGSTRRWVGRVSGGLMILAALLLGMRKVT